MFRKIKLLLIVSFLTISVFAQPKMIDAVIGVVGKNAILQSDIEMQYLQMQAQGYPVTSNSYCMLLEEYLYQKLLLNQAALDSIEVSDNEVDGELDGRLRYFIAQAGGESELEKYFNKSIYEIKEDFRDQVREQMLTRRMQDKITGDIKITPAEVQKFYNNLPVDSLPLIDAEYEIEQIVIYPTIKTEERQRIKDELNKMRDDFIAGTKKFESQAIMYSDDQGSAIKGGDIGFVNRADVVTPFAAAAFSLKAGEISKVVETEFGYHIIQLIEKQGEKVHVRHILKRPKSYADDKQEARQRLDSIIRLINLDTLTFAQAATKYSQDKDTKNNSGLLTNPQTGSARFGVNDIDPTMFYNIRSLNVGQMSPVFESDDPSGYKVYKVARLRAKTSPHRANIKEDYQKIKDLALADKKQKAIARWIEDKQQSSYVYLSSDYKTCNFKMGKWVK